jgi:predicted DNA-binding transcriptional regulator AlpA
MTNAVQIYSDLPETGYLRLPQVLRFIPIGRSSWWKGVKEGKYPASIKLGAKTTVWRAEDIHELIASFNNEAKA